MDDYQPNRPKRRLPMAVRTRRMTAGEAIATIAVIWLVAGTTFSAFMWALQFLGRLYWQ